MRLAKLCRCANPTRADDKKNLGKHEIEEAERFPQRFAPRFNVLFCALEIDAHWKLRLSILMFVARFFRRRRDVAEFAMTNFAAGISDVAASAESCDSKNDYANDEQRCRARPNLRRE